MHLRVFALVLLAPLSLGAQSDTTRLPATVITATRIPTAADAQTATVTVLDGAALRAEGLTHVGDALRRVPGLALARTSSFGSQQALFLRGGQSNYVRVLVDGVALNEPGGVLDLGRVTLDDVARIEVVRGPASVLYGSEAVTGVIQIFTRSGAGPTKWRSELGGGSYDAQRASLGASGGNAAFGWSLQGDRHRTDGILAFNNAYQNDGATGAITFAPDARTDLKLTTRFNTSQYQYPTGSDGSIEDRNAERTERRLMLGFEAGRKWTERLDSRAQFTAMDLRPRTSDRADDAADTLGFFGYVANATVKRRMVDARSTARLGDAQFLTLGGEWTRDTEVSESVSLSEFGDFPSDFQAARENRAVYAQAHGERGVFTYTLGGRLDENSAFGRFETARIGAAWRIAAPLRLRASAGTAFKAPSFFENFATGFTVGNADLQPERARSADLGIELSLPHGTAIRLTGFTQRFRDLIQYTGAPPSPGDPNYYNIAQANAGGVEFEASFLSATGLATTVAHTWTDTRVVDAGFDTAPEANFVDGGRLLRRPAHVTSVQLRRPIGDLGTFSATILRTGEREDRDFATWPASIVMLPPFTSVDVSSDLKLPNLMGSSARLLLRAENLFDVRTQQVAGFAAPGRVLYAGLRLER